MTTPLGADTTAVALALVENAKRLGLIWTLRLATVADGADPAAITAIYDGDTAGIAMTSMAGPVGAGNRVYVLQVPPSGNFIIGRASPPGLAGAATNIINMTAGTTTSGTLVNMPGPPTLTFEKTAGADTNLIITLTGTAYTTVAQAYMVFGVSVNGDAGRNVAALAVTNTAFPSAHVQYAGVLTITGVPAGTTVLIGMWGRAGGLGTLTVDTGDTWSLSAIEVPSQ